MAVEDARANHDLEQSGNLRFFSGVWLGLGIAAMWLVPSIERKTSVFRLVWIMMVLGGIGRLISMILVGVPPARFVLFAVIEIIGAGSIGSIGWVRRSDVVVVANRRR